jgi:predicted alpha/beta superfamily hydrolase
MNFKPATFILALLCCFSAAGQQKSSSQKEIIFNLTAPSLPDDARVFICGNTPQLADWDPSVVNMTFTGNHTWSKTIRTDNFNSLEYKYTLGSWQKEGAAANGKPLSNFIVKVTGDTIIRDIVLFWLNGENKRPTGQVTGNVKYHQQIKGIGIPDRDIIVWLPPDYEKNTRKRYPVLYMQDGQNIFDPATSAFGSDWQIDETCDSLIRAGIIEPLIVVGIYNTKNRMSEYTPGNEGSAYMKFLIDVVKPFVDRKYRSKPGRKFTYAGGSSAGGTITFMLVWNNPGIFSKAFCLSPAFKIQNIDVVKDVTGYSGKKKDITFYIDDGGKGLEEQLQPGIDEMMKALTEKGYIRNKDYFWVSDPETEHNESAWKKRMPDALKLLLGVKSKKSVK